MKLRKDKDILNYLIRLIDENEGNKINLSIIKDKIETRNTLQFFKYILDYLKKTNSIDIDEIEKKIIVIDKETLKQEINILLGGPQKPLINKKSDLLSRATQATKLKNKIEVDFRREDFKSQRIPLIISYPPSLNDKIRNLTQKYKNLQIFSFGSFLRYALSNAKKEVLICNPYIEIEGMLYIFSDIGELVEKNIKLKILTRDLIDRDSKIFRNDAHNKLKGLTKIFELYNSRYKLELIRIKDFTSAFRLYSTRSRLYESIHQKMILIDDNLCYIGSGEIRPSSLYNNGDLGCIFRDKEYLNFFKDFFYVFWDSDISYEIKFEDLQDFLQI